MKNWKFVNLSDVTFNLDNRRIPLNSSQRAEKESEKLYPYIGANNIMGYIDEYIFDEKILCVAEDGGSWGLNQTCAVIYNEKVWVNNHAHVLTAKDNLVLEYLRYYLNSADLNLYINGATRGKLTKTSLNSIQIPLPPLPQQQKIANILDAADALRQKDKALLAKYDELTQALFLDMFGDPVSNPKGWEMIKLEGFCEFENGDRSSNYPSGDEVKSSGKLFLSSGDIKKGRFIVKDSKFISNDKYNSLKRGKCYRNDVLMTLRGNGTGKSAIFDCEYEEGFINAQMVIIRPNNKCDPNYLVLQLNNPVVFKRLISFNSGSAQPQLSAQSVKEFKVFVPPVNLQNQFAERVKVIEQQKAIAQKSLEKSEELFNSLLQKAFKGELV
jgi:type I restriction enzyme S subunit